MARIVAFMLFLVTSCVPAQDLVISNARILDGTGGVIEQGSIVVSDGRIVSVSAGDPEARGVLEIDAQGMTVMPGPRAALSALRAAKPSRSAIATALSMVAW